MSPSEVVRQPSSCVRAADPAVSFFGLVAERDSEAVGELVLWATMRLGANKPSMHSRKPQTALPADLS